VRRNPWDEVECGHHYARSMSSWALLLALSGFHYDAARRSIAFAPARATRGGEFRCFFSAGTGWGTFEQQRKQNVLSASLVLDWGLLQLREVSLQHGDMACTIEASLNDNLISANVRYSAGAVLVEFEQQIELSPGDRLNVTLTDA
jgi:hypothetical protein